jgi:hypothetical protein
MKKLIVLFLFLMPFVINAQSTTPTASKTTKTTSAKKTTTKKASAKKSSTAKAKTTPPAGDAPPANTTGGMPKMTFEAKAFNFGKIKMGDKPEHTYNFTNTGNAPLDIEIVSGCDCTELEWTRTTVQPGEKGYVKAVYNSNKAEPEDHKKPLRKDITIVLKQTHTQSGYPLVEEIRFDVFIVD